jgi:hypothetical protein
MIYLTYLYSEVWTPRAGSFFRMMPKVVMFDGWDLLGGASWQQHTATNDWSRKNQPALDGVWTGKRRKGRSMIA